MTTYYTKIFAKQKSQTLKNNSKKIIKFIYRNQIVTLTCVCKENCYPECDKLCMPKRQIPFLMHAEKFTVVH